MGKIDIFSDIVENFDISTGLQSITEVNPETLYASLCRTTRPLIPYYPYKVADGLPNTLDRRIMVAKSKFKTDGRAWNDILVLAPDILIDADVLSSWMNLFPEIKVYMVSKSILASHLDDESDMTSMEYYHNKPKIYGPNNPDNILDGFGLIGSSYAIRNVLSNLRMYSVKSVREIIVIPTDNSNTFEYSNEIQFLCHDYHTLNHDEKFYVGKSDVNTMIVELANKNTSLSTSILLGEGLKTLQILKSVPDTEDIECICLNVRCPGYTSICCGGGPAVVVPDSRRFSHNMKYGWDVSVEYDMSNVDMSSQRNKKCAIVKVDIFGDLAGFYTPTEEISKAVINHMFIRGVEAPSRYYGREQTYGWQRSAHKQRQFRRQISRNNAKYVYGERQYGRKEKWLAK